MIVSGKTDQKTAQNAGKSLVIRYQQTSRMRQDGKGYSGQSVPIAHSVAKI